MGYVTAVEQLSLKKASEEHMVSFTRLHKVLSIHSQKGKWLPLEESKEKVPLYLRQDVPSLTVAFNEPGTDDASISVIFAELKILNGVYVTVGQRRLDGTIVLATDSDFFGVA
jgi:hypothetical protein